MSMRKAVLAVLALGLGLAAAGSVSAADTCTGVKIKFQNATNDEIKVTKIEYLEKDTNTWHDESDAFGPDGKLLIEMGNARSISRDLAKVKGDPGTKLRGSYHHHIGGNAWGPQRVVTMGPFQCTDGVDKTLVLNQ